MEQASTVVGTLRTQEEDESDLQEKSLYTKDGTEINLVTGSETMTMKVAHS